MSYNVIGAITVSGIEAVSGTFSWGLVIPTLTTTERDAIGSPVAGAVLYNSTTSKMNIYTDGWEEVTSG